MMFAVLLILIFILLLILSFFGTYWSDRLRARAYCKEFERANRKSKRQSSFGV